MPSLAGDPAIRIQGTLVAALEAAGFTDAHEIAEETEFVIPDEMAWWSSLWTHGERRLLERLDTDTLARLRDACFEHLQAIKEPIGLLQRQEHIYVVATRS